MDRIERFKNSTKCRIEVDSAKADNVFKSLNVDVVKPIYVAYKDTQFAIITLGYEERMDHAREDIADSIINSTKDCNFYIKKFTYGFKNDVMIYNDQIVYSVKRGEY